MVAETTNEVDVAKTIAQDMAATNGSIEYWGSKGGRHKFEYEGVVHAHLIADGWQITGFGRGWFAIEKQYH